MDWRRARHLASGALLAGALFAGAGVGSLVLLGSAEHRGDPVGRLSAHLAADTAAADGTRGSRAVAITVPASPSSETSRPLTTSTVVVATAPATTAPVTTARADESRDRPERDRDRAHAPDD